MAGHSQFANIKHRKGAQDAKRSKLFTKLTREIIVATAQGQSDPAFNPRLRSAIAAARKAGVARDRIEMAIKKGSGELLGEAYEEIRYEGYGPGGIALVIEVVTDNRNRSASDVRAALTKAGGALGESGSVSFMFDHVGLIQYPASVAGADDIFEAALEFGATNCESNSDFHEVTCEPTDLNAVKEKLLAKFGEPEKATMSWKPKNLIPVDDEEKAKAILKLMDALDESDDVQNISANFDIPIELASKFA